jgi:hypothetical protein
VASILKNSITFLNKRTFPTNNLGKMATNRDLLKEAIADAKAVKETAIANAKAALEEAFAPQVREMFTAKLQEMELEEDLEENYGMSEDEKSKMEEDKDETMNEIDLEELLRELELEEGDMEDLNEAEGDEEDDTDVSDEDSDEDDDEGTPLDLEDMTDEDLKSMIEDVIKDMIASGELEGGEEGTGDEEGMKMKDEEEVDLAELLREIEEMEGMDEAYGKELELYDAYFNPTAFKQIINKIEAAQDAGKLEDIDQEEVQQDLKSSLTTADVKDVVNALKEAYELNEAEMIKEAEEDFKAKAEAEITQLSKKSSVLNLAKKIGIAATAVGAILFLYGVSDGMSDSLTAKFAETVSIPWQTIVGSLTTIGGLVSGIGGAAYKYDADSEIATKKAELAKRERELQEAYKTIKTLKSELNEINLLNAKLLYTNKIFKAKNLNESQKVKVLSSFDKATTVGEVKLVFETLNEGIKVKSNLIKENLGRASKTTVTPNVKKPIVESNEAFLRMQKLAGII